MITPASRLVSMTNPHHDPGSMVDARRSHDRCALHPFDKGMKGSRCVLAILALALCPSTAMANAGTPLMWASMLHLAFGNAIIGIMEGCLLAWMFKCAKRKAILTLIVANYASAWAGAYFVAGYVVALPDLTIQTLQYWFLIFVLVAFMVTLLIELPFFWFVLRSQEDSWRRAFVATPVIHGISYALLMGWYWMASGTSMLTRLEVVPMDEMAVSEPHLLYFISREGNQVLRMDLSHPGAVQTVSELAAHRRNDRLFVRARDGSGFDLFVFLDSKDRDSETESRVLDDFSDEAPVEEGIAGGYSQKAASSWFNFGKVPTIGSKSDWTFRTGFWPVEGIRGENEKTGVHLRYSLETPFAAWPVRNATQISGDYVVAQLGDDQICLMHLVSGRIALIARGKGPIVAKPRRPDRVPGSE